MRVSRTRAAAFAAVILYLTTLYWLGRPCRSRTAPSSANVEQLLRDGQWETEHYRFAEGLRRLEAAQRLAPQSGAVYLALGKHFYRRQDYVRAVDQFVLAARYAPGNSEVLYYAGLLRAHLSGAHPEGTMLFFERACQKDPGNYRALREWLRLMTQTQGKRAALGVLWPRLHADPHNASLWWLMGEIHAASGEPAAAIASYQRALALDAKLAPAKLALGDALKRTGHPDRAVAQYWLGAMIDAKYTDGFYLAAQTLLEMKDYVQAESMTRNLIQIAPDYPGAYHLLADIYHAGERHDLAVEAMEQETKRHPENLTAKVDLADAYISVGRFERAIEVLKEVTKQPIETIREPRFVADWVRGHVVLSKAYRGLRRYDAAEAAARVASRFDNRSLYIKREMAYVKAGLDFGN